MDKLFIGIVLCLCLAACTARQEQTASDMTIRFKMMEVACQRGGQPNLFTNGKTTVLSWVEYVQDTVDALMYAKLQNDHWGAPVEIARGNNWFVNWADFPSMAIFEGDRAMAAQWLQKSDIGTYDYDVRVSTSTDQGTTWSESFIPHTDGKAAEHGFVSMVPVAKDRVLAVWLDGRNMQSGDDHEHGGHGHGAMTLRTAEFDISGDLFAEAELDSMVCECCQTDAVMTPDGPVVVYRDRSADERRDIAFVERTDGSWSESTHVHEDGWEIAGCPVNGPAIAAWDNQLAVAWFTAPGGDAQVNVAVRSEGNSRFARPIRVDKGRPIGRVDVVWLSADQLLVTWIENSGETGEIRAMVLAPDGTVFTDQAIHPISTSRRSGFPVIEKVNHQILLAWTELAGETASVKCAQVVVSHDN